MNHINIAITLFGLSITVYSATVSDTEAVELELLDSLVTKYHIPLVVTVTPIVAQQVTPVVAPVSVVAPVEAAVEPVVTQVEAVKSGLFPASS